MCPAAPRNVGTTGECRDSGHVAHMNIDEMNASCLHKFVIGKFQALCLMFGSLLWFRTVWVLFARLADFSRDLGRFMRSASCPDMGAILRHLKCKSLARSCLPHLVLTWLRCPEDVKCKSLLCILVYCCVSRPSSGPSALLLRRWRCDLASRHSATHISVDFRASCLAALDLIWL